MRSASTICSPRSRTFDERDFLAMQLDTRAEGYEQIRATILEVVADNETEPLLARARDARARMERPRRRRPTRVSHRCTLTTGRCWRAHARAAARARDRGRPELRLSLAARRRSVAAAARRAARAPPDARARGLACVPARGAARDAGNATTQRRCASTRSGASQRARRRASVRRASWAAREPALAAARAAAGIDGVAASRGARLRRRATDGRGTRPHSDDGVLELAGGQSGHFLSPQFRDQQRRIGSTARRRRSSPASPSRRFVLIP